MQMINLSVKAWRDVIVCTYVSNLHVCVCCEI